MNDQCRKYGESETFMHIQHIWRTNESYLVSIAKYSYMEKTQYYFNGHYMNGGLANGDGEGYGFNYEDC